MREIVVTNWDTLQAAAFEGMWDEDLLRYRNSRVYRGVADKHWGLIPSLNRCSPQNLGLERQILRSFRKYGYADLTNCHSFWQMVAMGQQYGLPTRLLDWTYSPLVAAHFATEDTDSYHLDGAIICCDMKKINHLLPEKFSRLLYQEKCNVFSMEMLDGVAADFSALKEVCDQPFSFFFEPASVVNRIANQYALFSLTSDAHVLIDTIQGADSAFTRIVIPAEVKLEIRDKLDYINISERMIYPGLDGICRWIARRYAPLGPRHHKTQPDSTGI